MTDLSAKTHNKMIHILSVDDVDGFAQMLNSGEGGMSVHSIDGVGRTLVYAAAGQDRRRCLRLLIESGASVNRCAINANDNKNRTPLIHAIRREHFETAEMLLDAGADPRVPDHDGKTALHAIVDVAPSLLVNIHPEELPRYLGLIDRLVAAGCPINRPDHQGLTPLMQTVSGDKLQPARNHSPLPVVEALLRNGANPNLADPNGRQMLHNSWGSAHLPLVRLLALHGADLNGRNRRGESPLFYAAYLEVAQELVELGADVTQPDNDGRTLFHHLIATPSLHASLSEIPAYLLGQGVDPRQPDYTGETALELLEHPGDEPHPSTDAIMAAIRANDAKQAIRATTDARRRNSKP